LAAPHPQLASFGPAEFAAAANVSRETLSRFKSYISILEDWNARHNLVSAGSLKDVWRRHVWDSAQLMKFVPPAAESLVDMGSGAGFPGLVLALLLRDRSGFRTVLYEATRKKCDFLRMAADRLELEVEIRNMRIEEAKPEPFAIVTARACAPLDRLLSYAHYFQGPGTVNLFHKGQSVGVELTLARKSWTMRLAQHASRSDPSGVILEIRELRHAA
jgi:16S rRNA (guanine527-N7)-methyltransferase